MRRPRHLSPDERALWEHVTRQDTPMADAPRQTIIEASSKPAKQDRPDIAPPLPVFKLGSKVDHRRDHDLLPGLAQQLRASPVQMDAKAHGKLKRGKLKPEARIDLHGMTVDQAHPALRGFILSEHAAGSRLVLVITGKGRAREIDAPMPVRHGILRHNVPQWLRLPPLNHLVLQITPANIRHGGDGAYYVYLRRAR